MNLFLKSKNNKLFKNNFKIIHFFFVIYCKKIRFYLAIFFYCLVLLAFILFAGFSNLNPTYLITNPITIVFLVLAITIIGSYISIEVFRSSIDDNSELLILSKPIKRISIFWAKIIIILFFALLTSLTSLIITSFTFLFSSYIYVTNIKVLLGVPLASFVIFIFFGSFGSLIAMFCKKSYSLLITNGSSVIFLIFGILNTLVVDLNNKDSASTTNLERSYLISLKTNKDQVSDVKVYLSSYSNSNSDSFLNQYSLVNQNKIFDNLLPINFYGQFSNMFSVNQSTKSFGLDDLLGLSVINYPYYPKIVNNIFNNQSNQNWLIDLPNLTITLNANEDMNEIENIFNLNYLWFFNQTYSYQTAIDDIVLRQTLRYNYMDFNHLLFSNKTNKVDINFFQNLIIQNLKDFLESNPTLNQNYSDFKFNYYLSLFSYIEQIKSKILINYYENKIQNYDDLNDFFNDLIFVILNSFAHVEYNLDFRNIDNLLANLEDNQEYFLLLLNDQESQEYTTFLSLIKLRILGLNYYSYFQNLMSKDLSNINNPWLFLDNNNQNYEPTLLNNTYSTLNYLTSNSQNLEWVNFNFYPKEVTNLYSLIVILPTSYFNSWLLFFGWLFFAFLLILIASFYYQKMDIK